MAGRVVAVATVLLVAGAVGVVESQICEESAYNPEAPTARGNEVWLYIYKRALCQYRSGIGTKGGYWTYNPEGVTEYSDYSRDGCDGSLTEWIKLGTTSKTKKEIKAIIEKLKNSCYPGYTSCWKFIPSNYKLLNWNSNYFSHHLADALGVVESFPSSLWSTIPGLDC